MLYFKGSQRAFFHTRMLTPTFSIVWYLYLLILKNSWCGWLGQRSRIAFSVLWTTPFINIKNNQTHFLRHFNLQVKPNLNVKVTSAGAHSVRDTTKWTATSVKILLKCIVLGSMFDLSKHWMWICIWIVFSVTTVSFYWCIKRKT